MVNVLTDFVWDVLAEVDRLRPTQCITAFSEHPEDLGRVSEGPRGHVPGSIWQDPRFALLKAKGWWSGAFKQCGFGAESAKPTRSMSPCQGFKLLACNSVPCFDEQDWYTGPVPKGCKDHSHVYILRRKGDLGAFKTKATAAYPAKLCELIAQCLFKDIFDSIREGTKSVSCWPSGGASSSRDTGKEETNKAKQGEVRFSFPPLPPSPPPSSLPANTFKLGESSPAKLRKVSQSLVLGPGEKLEMVDPSSSLGGGTQTAEVRVRALAKPPEPLEGIDFIKQGWWGVGEPLRCQKSPEVFGRFVHDGGGICSPGRWPCGRRVFPPRAEDITRLLDSCIDEIAGEEGEKFLEDICFGIFAQKIKLDPFAGLTGKLHTSLGLLLSQAGLSRPAGQWRKGQVIDHGLLFMLGQLLQDPDYSCMADFAQGVRLGVEAELPRTPAVWLEKKKWPLEEFGFEEVSDLNANYPSAKLHRDALLKEMEAQKELGWILPMSFSAAQARFGLVSVASLAVIEEAPGKHMVIHDGTNNCQVNNRIKVRDQEECPSALDVQACVSGDTSLQMPVLCFVLDIEKAHRRVPVCEAEWGL